MNIRLFRTARENFMKRGRPFNDPKEYSHALAAIEKAGAPEHIFENVGKGVLDQGQCSCGWKGKSFWDGADLAFEDWREHVADVIGLIPKECPCGKKYLPADGEKPCHELKPLGAVNK